MKQEKHTGDQKRGLLARLLSSINFMVTQDLSTKDKRQTPRIECRCEVEFVDENGKKGKGFLIDISKKGLQLETETRLAKGLTLAMKAPEEEMLDRTTPFMAKVRWTRKRHGQTRAGLALPNGIEEDPNWLESLLNQLGYSEDGTQRREYIRATTEISGQLTLDDEDRTTQSVELLNLGMGGALIKSKTPLPKDCQFSLIVGPFEDLPILSLSGTVLRLVKKEGRDFDLFPCRFNPTEEKDADILQEYILKLSEL